jgi:Domain of unknown function (DUF1707)
MRASDADRDRVVDALRAAAGDGRLTAEEFGERMEAALTSRTRGELAALTADLADSPGELAALTADLADSPGDLAGGPGGPGDPGHPSDAWAETLARDVMRIRQRGGSVQRAGRWEVPRRLELRSSGVPTRAIARRALSRNSPAHSPRGRDGFLSGSSRCRWPPRSGG